MTFELHRHYIRYYLNLPLPALVAVARLAGLACLGIARRACFAAASHTAVPISTGAAMIAPAGVLEVLITEIAISAASL